MAKKKKKVIATKSDPVKDIQTIKTSTAKAKVTARNSSNAASIEMPFGKQNYIWVLGGIALITLGMILMIGGYNADPNVWDESKIYGFQRLTLAPMLILTGLAIEIYAIFK